MRVRGIKEEHFVEGVKVGDLALIGEWTIQSDKVLVF
jgi:sulfur relay (sulfurtransferase) complex TusBCD TusD component (DsrE family)